VALPAAPDNTLPLESQRAHSRVMGFAFRALREVVSSGPAGPEHAFLGIFMKALPLKLRAEVAPVDVPHFSALLSNRSNTGIALQVIGGIEALALRTHGGQEPRSQHGPSARKASEDFPIRVLLKALSDLLFDGQVSSANPGYHKLRRLRRSHF